MTDILLFGKNKTFVVYVWLHLKKKKELDFSGETMTVT